jgi:hypothetical protein
MRVLKVQGVFLKLAGSLGWQTEVFPKFYSYIEFTRGEILGEVYIEVCN